MYSLGKKLVEVTIYENLRSDKNASNIYRKLNILTRVPKLLPFKKDVFF